MAVSANRVPAEAGGSPNRSRYSSDKTMSALTFPELSGTRPEVEKGPIRLGSEEHKRLFCRTPLETFNPYCPAVIDWPKLDAGARARITSLPIWEIAVQTENRASLNVCIYAESITDPLLRKAFELNGFEERRHRHVLSNLVEAYGIKLAPEPAIPRTRDPEWAFLVTGYSECIDSFFAFGLFEAARTSGYFPAELVETFEPANHEEGRHIFFFVNWVAWHRRNIPSWRRPWFELKVLAVWAIIAWERIGIAADVSNGVQDNNFAITGASQLTDDMDAFRLMEACLAENERRLRIHDTRLRRPRFVPFMIRTFRRFFGPKQAAAAV